MKIAAIKIGERVRKDIGDLVSLVASIERVGMLHPVVVTKEGVLVAGLRRIEAAKILRWPEVPATVVNVVDMLAAERDENSIRKEFTPTEAVAIKRLIEEEDRKRRPTRSDVARAGALRRWEKARGVDPVEMTPSKAGGDVRSRAAAAVGLAPSQLSRAEAVVSAAEMDPEKYGDLPARMDETRNVLGTYRELRRRKDSTTGRHPVHYKKRYPKTNEMIRRAINSLDGICSALEEVKAEEADATEAPAWAKSLDESASAIRSFAKRLKNVKASE